MSSQTAAALESGVSWASNMSSRSSAGPASITATLASERCDCARSLSCSSRSKSSCLLGLPRLLAGTGCCSAAFEWVL